MLTFLSGNLLWSVIKFKWLYLLPVQGVESSVRSQIKTRRSVLQITSMLWTNNIENILKITGYVFDLFHLKHREVLKDLHGFPFLVIIYMIEVLYASYAFISRIAVFDRKTSSIIFWRAEDICSTII